MAENKRLFTDRIIDSICFDEDKMDCLLAEIGTRVKKERQLQNYTVSELAEMTSMNLAHLYRIEKGERPIGLRVLIKIAWALNRPIQKFIPFEEVDRPKTNGERFEEMTRNLDTATINMLFEIVENLIKYNENIQST